MLEARCFCPYQVLYSNDTPYTTVGMQIDNSGIGAPLKTCMEVAHADWKSDTIDPDLTVFHGKVGFGYRAVIRLYHFENPFTWEKPQFTSIHLKELFQRNMDLLFHPDRDLYIPILYEKMAVAFNGTTIDAKVRQILERIREADSDSDTSASLTYLSFFLQKEPQSDDEHIFNREEIKGFYDAAETIPHEKITNRPYLLLLLFVKWAIQNDYMFIRGLPIDSLLKIAPILGYSNEYSSRVYLHVRKDNMTIDETHFMGHVVNLASTMMDIDPNVIIRDMKEVLDFVIPKTKTMMEAN